MEELARVVRRSDVFTDENQETVRELDICYCAMSSTGCKPGSLLKVGKLTIVGECRERRTGHMHTENSRWQQETRAKDGWQPTSRLVSKSQAPRLT